MKKCLFTILTVLTCILPANAYDFEVDGIYYNIISNDTSLTKTVEVTYFEYFDLSHSYMSSTSDSIVIPKEVVEDGCKYIVTKIGDHAFDGCTELKNVTISNSIISIGTKAFYNCTLLDSIAIPNSVKEIATDAFTNSGIKKVTISLTDQKDLTNYIKRKDIEKCFYKPTKLQWAERNISIGGKVQTELEIPDAVDSIMSWAFYYCENITRVSFPNSIKCNRGFATIFMPQLSVNIRLKDQEDLANYVMRNDIKECFLLGEFYGGHVGNCSVSIGGVNQTHINIPNSVDSIKENAFANCNNIDIVVPNSVISIGEKAFWIDEGTVTLPDELKSFDSNAFGPFTKVYANLGSNTMLLLWNKYIDTYDIKTKKLLDDPWLTVADSTQTTVTFKIKNYYKEYKYLRLVDGEYTETDSIYKLSGLNPGERNTESIIICKDVDNRDIQCNRKALFWTRAINPQISIDKVTASSIIVRGTYVKGDADIESQKLYLDQAYSEDGIIDTTSLNPDREYNARYVLTLKNGKRYECSKDITTNPLVLSTQQPKVISTGNVIIAARTNVDDREWYVGFEWRRTDWTDEFASNTGTGYLYKGTIEGYIRNLPEGYLWKYRPYYITDIGIKYYGDWVGIDPLNTSYFEPTVHTYDYINVNSNKATVRGFAQRGTDDIVEQGFKYWRGNSTSAKSNVKYAMSIPDNAKTIAVPTNNNNPIMVTTLTGLDYNAEYHVVAFITTSESSFYGVEQIFTTGDDPTGIESVKTDTGSRSYTAGIYDLNGRKLDSPQRGVNIIRFEDGTVKKILMK